MVIENNNAFIPVNITLLDHNKATVRPTYLYEANSNHTLKIFLNNGKKYKKNFTTRSYIKVTDEQHFVMKNGTIIDYTGLIRVVVIPSKVNGETVNTVDSKAFFKKT